jgi:hypothetical protein
VWWRGKVLREERLVHDWTSLSPLLQNRWSGDFVHDHDVLVTEEKTSFGLGTVASSNGSKEFGTWPLAELIKRTYNHLRHHVPTKQMLKQLNRKPGRFVDLFFDICLPVPLPTGGLGIKHVDIYSQLHLYLMACAVE